MFNSLFIKYFLSRLMNLTPNLKKTGKYSESLKDIAPYMGLSWQMIITIGIFALLGWWLDKSFDSKPLWLVIGSIIGVAVAIYSFIRTVRTLDDKNKKKTNQNFQNEENEKE
jgi:F0F1-type ATP synthase assembly protein I